MPAIMIQKGTKYACNVGYKGNQLCMQSQLGWGSYMPAILVQKENKCACNVSNVRDHICLQLYLKGTQ